MTSPLFPSATFSGSFACAKVLFSWRGHTEARVPVLNVYVTLILYCFFYYKKTMMWWRSSLRQGKFSTAAQEYIYIIGSQTGSRRKRVMTAVGPNANVSNNIQRSKGGLSGPTKPTCACYWAQQSYSGVFIWLHLLLLLANT